MTSFPVTRPAPDLPPGPRAALVVATSTYADPALTRLEATTRDAEQMAAVLGDPEIGAFEVTSVLDSGAQEIRVAVHEFLAGRGREDLVVVYLSCHGLLDARDRLYFAAADTRKDQMAANGVEAAWLLDRLEECRAARQAVILDCCFSGAFANGGKGEADTDLRLGERLIAHGRGRAVLTASKATERSWEGDPVGGVTGPSVFTSALVEGLRTGDADTDRDGYISVDDAYAYAYEKVIASGAGQTPQHWTIAGEGTIYLARSPAGLTITPAPLPEPLRVALDNPLPAVRVGAVNVLGEWLASPDPAKNLTALQALQRIAETDVPAVATAARTAVASAKGPASASPGTPPRPSGTPEHKAPLAGRATGAGMIETRTYRALLIANSTYPVAPHDLPELEGPRNDPAVLRDALCEEGVGLFPPDNVRLVTERTTGEIQLEIEDVLRTATSRDTVLLYYSGHARQDIRDDLYLCCSDTRPDLLWATAVSASFVSQAIEGSAAGTTIVVLDCCHSGAFEGVEVATSLAGDGRFVLASSRASELARDTDVRDRASVFTAALVEGLRSGAKDRDGVVTLDDLYDYVHGRLSSSAKQTPFKRFSGAGDLPIALRRLPGRATLVPGLVRPNLVRPELDVSPSEIDLGDVDPNEELPPERVTVVNRGGGSLHWTVDTSCPWVRAEVTDYGAELHLRPPAGATRASVYFGDPVSGAQKTVRLKLRCGTHHEMPVEPAPAIVDVDTESTAARSAYPVIPAQDPGDVTALLAAIRAQDTAARATLDFKPSLRERVRSQADWIRRCAAGTFEEWVIRAQHASEPELPERVAEDPEPEVRE
jgi:uncharacterized caspase-like protein